MGKGKFPLFCGKRERLIPIYSYQDAKIYVYDKNFVTFGENILSMNYLSMVWLRSNWASIKFSEASKNQNF